MYMKKNLFCLLVAALVLVSFPSFACEHTDSGEVADHELEEANKVPPQKGVAGSVDLVCPICGALIEHVILPALPEEAKHPASTDEENQPATVQVAQPVQPEQPAQPKQPEAPVQPARPENPAPQSDRPEAVITPDDNEPSQLSGSQPPKAQDVVANVPAQSGGSGAVRNAGRANTGGGTGNDSRGASKPQTFPFRRIKMKPQPGIRAEAAGQLLWPLYGTPFQSIYND